MGLQRGRLRRASDREMSLQFIKVWHDARLQCLRTVVNLIMTMPVG
jgi:hypothetical protein